MSRLRDPCKFVGVEGDQCQRLHQLLEAPPKTRKKRAPSIWNLYSKACITAKGGVQKFGQMGPLMKECGGEYREDKKAGKWRYVFEVPQQASNPNPTLYKGRDLQAEWKDMYERISGRR